MSTTKQETENTAVAFSVREAFEAGQKTSGVQVINGGVILHHKDFEVTDTRAQQEAEDKRLKPSPANPAGTIHVHRPDSFPVVFADYRNPRTKVFADAKQRSIVSVFDFIRPDNENPGHGEGAMGWGQFRALMRFSESRKLGQWDDMTDWHSQADFANFLEDHLEDVIEPNGQDLLALATDLEANKEGHFKGKLNLDNGSVQLAYQDEVQTSVEVPRRLTLGIPLFEHGDRYKLEVRLRINVTSGGVRFKILFTNLEDALEEHFESIVQELEEKTGEAIVRGSLSLDY